MQDAGNFNYNRMITEGMDHIGKVDSLKGEQVFIKVNDKPVDGRIYTFISSSELQSKSLPEQLKFVKVPDAVMKDMLKNASANYKQFSRTAKTGTVIIDKHEVALENDQIINAKRSAEEFKAIKNRISQSRGKFTSFKSAISIFTRLKSKMTYNKLSAERENRSLLDPILTKTEEKIQEKLNAKLNTQKKIADFPEKMNLKPRVFSKQELGRPPKHREELKKKYANNQIGFAKQMCQLAQNHKKSLSMIDENLDSPLELDHISSINNLSWILGLGGEVNDTNKQILDDNTKLFTSQSDTLKALNENVGIDINGQAKAKAHLANVLDKDENITLGEYLQATGLDKVLDMMQYFLKEDS